MVAVAPPAHPSVPSRDVTSILLPGKSGQNKEEKVRSEEWRGRWEVGYDCPRASRLFSPLSPLPDFLNKLRDRGCDAGWRIRAPTCRID